MGNLESGILISTQNQCCGKLDDDLTASLTRWPTRRAHPDPPSFCSGLIRRMRAGGATVPSWPRPPSRRRGAHVPSTGAQGEPVRVGGGRAAPSRGQPGEPLKCLATSTEVSRAVGNFRGRCPGFASRAAVF